MNKITGKKKIAVIPAYNEQDRVGRVVAEVLGYVDGVIVVDDASDDNTAGEAEAEGAEVIRLKHNMGAGYATRVGCDRAVREADLIITLDADGQHDPGDIPLLLDPVMAGVSDIVFGSRARNRNMPLVKRLGNSLMSRISRVLFKIEINDTLTGFHAFCSKCYPRLRWESDRYGVVSEFVYRVAESRLRYAEVPVQTIYTGKKAGMRKRDGLKSILYMLKWRFIGMGCKRP